MIYNLYYFLYKIYISKHTNLKTGHTNFFVLGKDYFMQILCLGDSITDCNHLFEDFPLGNGYVQLLAEKLPCNVQIKNHGIDGFTVSRILENIQTHRISLHRNPIITLLVGINDIGLIMNTHRTEEQKQQMLKEFTVHYKELLKLLTADAQQVILMEPFIFPCPAEYQNWIPYVSAMSQKIRSLSFQFSLPFLPLQDYLNKEASVRGFPAVTTDGIHLTALGHRLLAERLYPLLSV